MKIFQQHYDVSRETIDRLIEYEKILLMWNKKINLIGSSTENNIWIRHFLDSAQLKSLLNFSDSVLDVGSGAGFPGMVLSILGIKKVILLEKNFKKCTFLNYVISKLGLDCVVVNKSVEDFDEEVEVIVSRAFADVEKILDLTKNINYKKMLLLKSKNVATEFNSIDKISYKTYNCIDLTNSVIVEITK